MHRDPEARRAYARTYYREKHPQTKPKGRPPKGEDERRILVNVRISAGVVGHLNRLVQESIAFGATPWRTMSKMVEELVVRGLRTVDDDKIQEAVAVIEAMKGADYAMQNRRDVLSIVGRTKTEIAELLRIGASAAAAEFFLRQMQALHKMEETTWQQWAIKDLTEAYPELADRAAHIPRKKPRRLTQDVTLVEDWQDERRKLLKRKKGGRT